MPRRYLTGNTPNLVWGGDIDELDDNVVLHRRKDVLPGATSKVSQTEYVTVGNYKGGKLRVLKETLPPANSKESQSEWIDPPFTQCATWNPVSTLTATNNVITLATGTAVAFTPTQTGTDHSWVIASTTPATGKFPPPEGTSVTIGNSPPGNIITNGTSLINPGLLVSGATSFSGDVIAFRVEGLNTVHLGETYRVCPTVAPPATPPLKLTTTIVGCAEVDRGFSKGIGKVTAVNGTGPYTFTIPSGLTTSQTSGNFRNLSFSSSPLDITGDRDFIIQVEDSVGATASITICVRIVEPSININALPLENIAPVIGQDTFIGSAIITGGSTPYEFSNSPGLTLGTPSGNIYPMNYRAPDDTQEGVIMLNISATDSTAPPVSGSTDFTIGVISPPLTISSNIPANNILFPGETKELGTVVAAGGSEPYTFTEDEGLTKTGDGAERVYSYTAPQTPTETTLVRNIRVADASVPTKRKTLAVNISFVTKMEISNTFDTSKPLQSVRGSPQQSVPLSSRIGSFSISGGTAPYTFESPDAILLEKNLSDPTDPIRYISITNSPPSASLGNTTGRVTIRDSSPTPQTITIDIPYEVVDAQQELAVWDNSPLIMKIEGFEILAGNAYWTSRARLDGRTRRSSLVIHRVTKSGQAPALTYIVDGQIANTSVSLGFRKNGTLNVDEQNLYRLRRTTDASLPYIILPKVIPSNFSARASELELGGGEWVMLFMNQSGPMPLTRIGYSGAAFPINIVIRVNGVIQE